MEQFMTEKEKVLASIRLLRYYKYSCHALSAFGAKESTIKLYEKFLASHYPMFFEIVDGDLDYQTTKSDYQSFEGKIFNPGKQNTKIRTIFLKQFSEYL